MFIWLDAKVSNYELGARAQVANLEVCSAEAQVKGQVILPRRFRAAIARHRDAKLRHGEAQRLQVADIDAAILEFGGFQIGIEDGLSLFGQE
jgi:hypothetical protein